jgi:hypothetical protein
VPTPGQLLEGQLARLLTRGDQTFTPLRLVATAISTAALVIVCFELFWRFCT